MRKQVPTHSGVRVMQCCGYALSAALIDRVGRSVELAPTELECLGALACVVTAEGSTMPLMLAAVVAQSGAGRVLTSKHYLRGRAAVARAVAEDRCTPDTT